MIEAGWTASDFNSIGRSKVVKFDRRKHRYQVKQAIYTLSDFIIAYLLSDYKPFFDKKGKNIGNFRISWIFSV